MATMSLLLLLLLVQVVALPAASGPHNVQQQQQQHYGQSQQQWSGDDSTVPAPSVSAPRRLLPPLRSSILSSDSADRGQQQHGVTLENGFVRAVLTLVPPSLTELRGDFAGGGRYGNNSLGAPFRLSSSAEPSAGPAEAATLVVVENSTTEVVIRLLNVHDSALPVASENWTVRLARGSRELEVNTTGALLPPSQRAGDSRAAAAAPVLLHTVGFVASSITGHFDKGLVQARGKGGAMEFASNSSLPRLYALGEGSSVDIHRGSAGTPGIVTLRSGDAPAMQFGLGSPGRRASLWPSPAGASTAVAEVSVQVPPPAPAGFEVAGNGNCLPNLAQWYGQNASTAHCAAVCAAAALCLGYDWGPGPKGPPPSAGECRVRFPYASAAATPPPGCAADTENKPCGNITGGNGGKPPSVSPSTCYRRSEMPRFTCPPAPAPPPLPPPPPPPPPAPPLLRGFSLVGAGNCLPNLAQWYSSDSNITAADCGMICANNTLCLGFDWAGASCRVRFPLTPNGSPPPGFALVSASTCGNISGTTVKHNTCTHPN